MRKIAQICFFHSLIAEAICLYTRSKADYDFAVKTEVSVEFHLDCALSLVRRALNFLSGKLPTRRTKKTPRKQRMLECKNRERAFRARPSNCLRLDVLCCAIDNLMVHLMPVVSRICHSAAIRCMNCCESNA